MKRLIVAALAALFFLAPVEARGADVTDVTFLTKVQAYETVRDTTLTTQEGKRVQISKGTKLNVAGFTKTEAFVVSRKDKPNGFVRKSDIVRAK